MIRINNKNCACFLVPIKEKLGTLFAAGKWRICLLYDGTC